MSVSTSALADAMAGIRFRPPVSDRSAWIGAELAKHPEEWSYRLSATDLAEIDAAVAAVRARGLAIEDILRTDFPLPTLGPRLDEFRREVVHGRGFILLRGLPVEDRPVSAAATAYWGVGTYFGRARSQNSRGHLLGHVRSEGLSAADPHVRHYQTSERQTFHVDSCDVVGLLCLKIAKRGGESKITSSVTIYNRMLAERPDLLAGLFKPIPVDRRGEVPEGAKPYFDMPVFNEHLGYLSVFYMRPNIETAQRFPEARRLTKEEIEALDYFDALADDPQLRLDMVLAPGDMQFLHNHTVLHDRTAYEDYPEKERRRHLLRLWLSAPDARPLPDSFALRYGSTVIGDRGGIICRGPRVAVELD
ncbi:MAG TPA: TauD/TfdA family dioxygenase [Stellaceae bacterium]|nr:TauD/TfdA family dioxygenase [Stellaceae bacterium]